MGEQGNRDLWEGPCIGGPMSAPGSPHGQSRYPKGFVLYDKPNQLVWIYEWSEMDRMFFAVQDEPTAADPKKIRALRDRYDYDIRSAEAEVSDVYHEHHTARHAR